MAQNVRRPDPFIAAAEAAYAADLAERRMPPRLIILCGIPGSGKVRQLASPSSQFCQSDTHEATR